MKVKKAHHKDYSHISNMAELTALTRDLRATVRHQERELRDQVKALPSEALKAGTSRIFSGKPGEGLGWKGALTGVAVTAGTALLGTFLTKKATAAVAGKAGAGLVKNGLVALAPVLLKLLSRKKRAS